MLNSRRIQCMAYGCDCGGFVLFNIDTLEKVKNEATHRASQRRDHEKLERHIEVRARCASLTLTL